MNLESKFVNKKTVIRLLYILLFIFLCGKMAFYVKYVRGYPDEVAHISYILYMDANQERIVPKFEDMYVYKVIDNKGVYEIDPETPNYLGHAPFYYKFLSMIDGAYVQDNQVHMNLKRVRFVNSFFVLAGILLLYFQGYKYIKKETDSILPHAILAVSAISVPMFAFVGSGLNNDNLVFFGMSLLAYGIFELWNGKREYVSFHAIAIGFAISAATKLNSAGMSGVILAICFIALMIREKKLSAVFNKYFWSSSFWYIIPVIYYGVVYARYKSFKPGIGTVHPELFKSTNFYVEPENRVVMTFTEYIKYFIDSMAHSWSSLYGYVVWENKTSWYELIGAYAIVIISLAIVVWLIFEKRHDKWAYISYAVAIIAALGSHFIRQYGDFVRNGYTGGIQGRYYICLIYFMAMAGGLFFALLIKNAKKSVYSNVLIPVVYATGIIYIMLMLYGDFIYFMIHHGIGLMK